MAASNRDGRVHILAELLTRFQAAGDSRADLDPNAMAIAIRAVIDTSPGRLADWPAGRLADWPTQRSTSTDTPAKQSRSSTAQRL